MRALLDTDVLLDVGLNRDEFVAYSAQVLQWAEKTMSAAIAWHSISNCAYLLKDNGRAFLNNLLKIVTVAEVGHEQALLAMRLNMKDLEDALQVAAAESWKADFIVTRNLRHYATSPVRAVNPKQFLRKI